MRPLLEVPRTEIDAYLAGSKGIVIPIGSTEQHGPNGLLGTDAICPEVIAKRAGDEAGFLVGPTFNVGQAQHHMAFAGTITLRPGTAAPRFGRPGCDAVPRADASAAAVDICSIAVHDCTAGAGACIDRHEDLSAGVRSEVCGVLARCVAARAAPAE